MKLSLLLLYVCIDVVVRCIELVESSDPAQAMTVPQLPAPAPSVPIECNSSYSCARNLGLFEGLSHAIRTRSLPLTGNGGQLGPGLTSTDAKMVTVRKRYRMNKSIMMMMMIMLSSSGCPCEAGL